MFFAYLHAYKFLLREKVGYAAVLWRLRQCVSCLPLIRILDIVEKRMRKAIAKKAPFGPAMYPSGTARFEMIPMGTLPKNRPRDTPKVVPLEDDIIYDNRKSAGSEMRRDDGDSRRDMP